MRIEKKVFLKSISDVEKIVEAADKCDFHIKAVNEKMIVNVNSLLGMISEMTGKTITIKFETDDTKGMEFYYFLKEFAV